MARLNYKLPQMRKITMSFDVHFSVVHKLTGFVDTRSICKLNDSDKHQTNT